MNIKYFNEAAGQLICEWNGTPVSIDVPVQDGKFISGEPLLSYLQGFIPSHMTLRALEVASAQGAADVHAMCEQHKQEPTPSYADLRRASYPPATDYLDGLVKGDEEQMQAYIAQCREVKAMYPKVLVDDDVMRRRLQEAL